jgi:hypothetical protein
MQCAAAVLLSQQMKGSQQACHACAMMTARTPTLTFERTPQQLTPASKHMACSKQQQAADQGL